MKAFKQRLLETKRVSLWGIGYLGYTMLLRLQASGFEADVFDFDTTRLADLSAGRYPLADQKLVWSAKGEMPSLDLSRIRVVDAPAAMFANPVHIVSFPGRTDARPGNRLEHLAAAFAQNRRDLGDALVLFQSAEVPGDLNRHFIDPLQAQALSCDCATVFRTDWFIEEYFYGSRRQVMAANNGQAFERARFVLNVLGIAHVCLAGVREAELYECARKALHHSLSSFINQLVLAYPDIDVRRLIGLLFQDTPFEGIRPSIGSIGYKAANATRFLLEGSRCPDCMTMVRDANVANISTILNYADIIRRRQVDSVTVLGICERGDQKDVRLSSALVLAEHLIGEGVAVWLHDPYFTAAEIEAILPGARYADIPHQTIPSPCVVLMADHRFYRFFNQQDLERFGLASAALVIDNIGMWQEYRFGPQTIYHMPGDGTLNALEH